MPLHRTLAARLSLILLGASLCVVAAPAPAGAVGLVQGRLLRADLGLAWGGRLGDGSAPGALYSNFTLGLQLLPVVPEIGFRIGTSPNPSLSLIDGVVGVRLLFPTPPLVRPSLRLAFVAQNELSMDKTRSEPFRALFGTHPATVHREGLEADLALHFLFDPHGVFGLWTQASALVFLDDDGISPLFTGLLEGGITLAFGPR